MKNNKFFKFLLLVTALVVAGVAAYFSVFGISKLFAGAFISAIVMASSLEVGKLILSSYLYRVWDSISKIRRAYGVVAVGILMLITSVGIYGFLSNAFESTSIQVEQMDSKIEIMDTRISSKESETVRYQDLISDKQGRINTLTDLRKSQETRLDSLLANEHWVNASRTTTSIKTADEEIQKLYTKIDELNVRLDTTNNQVIALKTDKLNYKGEESIAGEVGPLKYISRLTGTTMDRVVNWVILLLIFVFDPLAIYLILSYNHLAMKDERTEQEEEPEPEKSKGVYQPIVDNTTTPPRKLPDNETRKKLSDKYSDFKKKVKEPDEEKKVKGEPKEEKSTSTTKKNRTRMNTKGGIEYY